MRRTVSLHLSSLRDEVVAELTVANPEDRVEDEDLASSQCTDQLVDKVIAPCYRLLVSCRADGRFRRFVAATHDHHADSLESIRDDRTLWWTIDV